MMTTTMTWEESILLTNYNTIIILIIGCDCASGGGPSFLVYWNITSKFVCLLEDIHGVQWKKANVTLQIP